jgi:Flp pilus assembly protein TadG
MTLGAVSGSRRREAGSITVELVVLAPVVTAFLLITLAMGRDTLAHDQVASGARAAAEAASIAPSLELAQVAAVAAASPALQSVHACRAPSVRVMDGSFEPGSEIRVVVSCRVDFSGLLVPGLPGSTTVSSTATAVIDPYRAVTP